MGYKGGECRDIDLVAGFQKRTRVKRFPLTSSYSIFFKQTNPLQVPMKSYLKSYLERQQLRFASMVEWLSNSEFTEQDETYARPKLSKLHLISK